jgi:hypothetical protein
MIKIFRALPLLILSLAGHTTYASTIVAPNAYAAATGTGNLNTPTNPLVRTYEMQIAASELTGIAVGSSLNGLSWRLASAVIAAGTGTRTWGDYEITLAQATNTVAGMGSNFAANMLNPVLVHDGALSYDFTGFSATGTPKPFAPAINFSTAYTYLGGDLVVLISHSTALGGVIGFLDSLTSTSVDYGSKYRAISANAFQAATATTTANFTITQFNFTAPVPEPSAMALFGIGLLGLMARRSKLA